MEISCCSAPGKVLITGGYLILERPYKGLVLTVNARFYSVVQSLDHSFIEDKKTLIEVHSPQFHHIEKYIFNFELYPFQLLTISEKHIPNPYTETAILFTLSIISFLIDKNKFESILKKGIHIIILGDNNFYSQIQQLKLNNLPLLSSSLNFLPKFLPHDQTNISSIHKTGLGSSAALTTSLIASILNYFQAIKIPSLNDKDISQKDLTLLHNLSQYCHCIAQNKIGSGFDISSAVYGSQCYTRFSKEILFPILIDNLHNIPPISKLFEILTKPWDNEVKSFSLPLGMNLLLGDVYGGSNTPSMSSKVLKWWFSNKDISIKLIEELNLYNNEIEKYFSNLHQFSIKNKDYYFEQLQYCKNIPSFKWNEIKNSDIAQTLFKLQESFFHIRRLLREIGKYSEVDIEPQSQQELIDKTMKINGVLIAGVPGAGGFDAIFCITIDSTSSKEVESLWTLHQVLPLLLKEDSRGVFIDNSPIISKL